MPTIIDPQGIPRAIPDAQVDAALKNGGTRAVLFADPEGKRRWIPEQLADQAEQAGGKRISENAGKAFEESFMETSPVGFVKSLVTHPVDTVSGLPHALKQEAHRVGDQLEEAWNTPNNQPIKAIDRTLYAIPFIGAGLKQADEQAAAGNYRGAAGSGLGTFTSLLAPEAEKVVSRGVRTGVSRIGDAAREIPQTIARKVGRTVLDETIPGDTVTPRERYNIAKGQGVQLDLAQATNAKNPATAKKISEKSWLGSGEYKDLQHKNRLALESHTAQVLDQTAPPMSREDFGHAVRSGLTNRLQREYNGILDAVAPAMPKANFGAAVRAQLLEHQQKLYEDSGKIFDELSVRGDEVQPDAGGIRKTAQNIMTASQGYFDKLPKMLKGAMKGSRDIVGMLAENPDAAYTWTDLQNLRSDLMNEYTSPEIVGTKAEGWLKQLAGSVNRAMEAASSGLSTEDLQQYRQANALYSEMKSQFDDPRSPLYSIVRSKEPLTVADTVSQLKPEMANYVMEVAPELREQMQRQVMEKLLSPAGNQIPEWKTLPNRWGRAVKAQLRGVLTPEQINSVETMAHTSGLFGGLVDPAAERLQIANAVDRLGPQGATRVAEALPGLRAQMQRQKMERILSPSGNVAPEWSTLPTRFNRAVKEQLAGHLTPDQVQHLENIARTSRIVNAESNPSGTATQTIPVAEAGTAIAGVGTAATGVLTGNPYLIAKGGLFASLPLASKAVAKAITSPKVIEGVMRAKGPAAWMEKGAANLQKAGVAADQVKQLRSTATGRQILKDAGDLSPKSRGMQALLKRIRPTGSTASVDAR